MKFKDVDMSMRVGALALCAFAIGASVLSRQFVFGLGHADRPIMPMLLLYVLAWIGFAFATLRVWRREASSSGLVVWIVAVAVVARLLMASSSLIQENDCYRYVLDGEALLHGVNPFRFTPEEVVEASTGRFAASLQRDDAQLILSRISYQDIPTIYPPLSQAAFALGAWLTPWSWHGQRIVFLAADLLTIFVLIAVLARLGRPRAWVIFYAWNPLVIKEISNSAHLESLLGLALAGLLLSCCLYAERQSRRHLFYISIAFSAAVLCKLYPIMLAPIVAAFVWRTTRSLKSLCALGVACLAIGLLAYAPFLSVGVERLTEGLRTFGQTWERNAGLFALLNGVTPYAREIVGVGVLLAVLAGTMSVLRSSHVLEGMIRSLQWVMLIWFLTLPMVFPWYALGLLTVSTCRPRVWALILSGMFGLYYVIFFSDYNELQPDCLWLTAVIEHGVVIGVIVLESQRARRGRELWLLPRDSDPLRST